MPPSASTLPVIQSDDVATHLATGQFDFIDFGCSKGGSLSFAKEKLGGRRGLGVDISPTKVAQARHAGFDACLADARELSLHPGTVRFVTMIHFLEHVPNAFDAARCLEAACTVARQFVYIRQPWFDSDGYLLSLGLKLYWSDWIGHPNTMTSLELFRILARIQNITAWRLYARRPITSSSHPAVHPLSSPPDQHEWKSELHAPKPEITFTLPVYSEIGCVISLSEDPSILPSLEKGMKWDRMLLNSKKLA